MKEIKWIEKPLGELISYVARGITPKYSEEEGIVVLNQKCIRDYNVSLEASRLHDTEKRKVSEEKQLAKYDILVNSTGVGTAGRVAQWDKDIVATVDSHVTIVRPDITKIDPLYLGYAIKAQQRKIETFAEGSTGQTELNKQRLCDEITILYPNDMKLQKSIATMLKHIDDKINLNSKLNANLIELASNLHKQWFLDFDFEGFDGKMEESEVGEIPLGWEVTELGMLMENFDRKRKPLSSRQRQERKGAIPYYGATSIMDYVDDFIFDDIYVLMGEDGSVMKEDGTPFLQYIWGKSWINNHAHVLKGKVFSTEILYLYLLKMNVASIVTGAVQLKISQGNMNSLKVVCAPREIYKTFDEIIQPIFIQLRNIQEQNKSLTTLRNTILPKLMSGEMNLDDIEI